MLKRFTIALLVFAGSWWAMMACHELGHILGAMFTGGKVIHVELRPWCFSRTDVDPNPHPGFVVWAGPLVGVALPVLLWLAATRTRSHTIRQILRWFAGFCLIANGCYIGAGWMINAGDTSVMHLTGTPPWVMGAFGIACFALGLWLWHGLGSWREFLQSGQAAGR